MSWRRIADRAKRSHPMLHLADQLGRGRGRLRWLDHLNIPPRVARKPDLQHWDKKDLSAVWIGHATVLLRLGDMNILTDPVLSHRVGIGLGLMTGGPRRMTAAALTERELPPIDLILVSHAHFDHLDRPTLSRLPKQTPIIASHGTLDLIRDLGFRRATELRWGESLQVRDVKITARQVRHWGARTFFDQHRGFSAFLLEGQRRRVLYGGDTAYHDHFKDIRRVDLAILGIGAYDPYVQSHATPEQAWEMADHMHADYVLPMHHSTFCLSHEPMDEPMQRMLQAAGTSSERIITRAIGDQWTAP